MRLFVKGNCWGIVTVIVIVEWVKLVVVGAYVVEWRMRVSPNTHASLVVADALTVRTDHVVTPPGRRATMASRHAHKGAIC